MKKILFILIFLFPNYIFATGELNSQTGDILETNIDDKNINYSIDIESEVSKQYKSEVSINTQYKIDLTDLYNNLKILNPEKDFIFSWDLKGAKSQSGSVFSRTFSEKGEKELELKIFEVVKTKDDKGNDEINTKLIFSNVYEILVYEKSFFLVYSDEVNKNDIDSYIDFSKKDGVFINKIGPLNKTNIELTSIVNNIEKYEKLGGLKSDFIIIWGSRDFVFNILSNINKDLNLNDDFNGKYNIVCISGYNMNILGNYLKNFLANKSWINKIFLINESSKYLLLKQNLIGDLEKELNKNKHDFINVNLTNNDVNNIFFISKFINNLSNLGYSTNSIYIFLIIPIILTFIIFFKHFIGLSPIGIAIPLFVTLLFFKLGLFTALFLIIFYVSLNLFLSIIANRYNLLYSPKIVFLISINIIIFILLFNIGYSFGVVGLNASDILYFIIFIILSEKMINIIISKDLLEYKENFFYTMLISIICFGILSIDYVKVFILSYPEIILLLIPINFLIGRFTGLRITEYFRFREVINSIEE